MITTLLLAALLPQIATIDHMPEPESQVSEAEAQAGDTQTVPASYIPINQTILIINDDVLTQLDVTRAALAMKKNPNLAGASASALQQGALMELARDLLFSQGAIRSGISKELVMSIVNSQIGAEVKKKGSIPAFQRHLASLGTNMTIERNQRARQLLAQVFQQQVLGYQPVGAKRLMAQLYATPEAMYESYQDDPERFYRPEQVTAQIIRLKDDGQGSAEEVIRLLRNEIMAGKLTFDEAARKHSQYRGGEQAGMADPTDPATSSFSQPVRDYMMTGEIDVVSDPIQDKRAWYLMTIKERSPAGPLAFAEAQAFIKKELKDQQRAGLMYAAVIDLRASCSIWVNPRFEGILDLVEAGFAQAVKTIGPPEEDGISF